MSFTKDEKKTFSNNGYTESAYDSNKMIRGNDWIKKEGSNTINWGGSGRTYNGTNAEKDRRSK